MNKILKFLYSLEESRMKFGFERVNRLLSLLNDPHKEKNIKFIHIAGTNGKGSVVTFLSYILKEAGYKVGSYISPHVYKITERIRINNKPISTTKFLSALNRIIPLIEKNFLEDKPSFFEVLTCTAFLIFKEENIDIGVIEVGLGGRLDATSVIYPSLCILTSIDYDHTQYLGNTLEEILQEKAAIIKENATVISGVLQDNLVELLRDICQKTNSRLYQIKKDFYSRSAELFPSYTSFKFVDLPSLNIYNINIKLGGNYQVHNASLATKAAIILGIKPADIIKGLTKAKFSARFEIINTRPYKILLDGAHNPAAFSCLLTNLKIYFKDYKWRLILGFSKDKDIPKMIELLTEYKENIEYLVLTRANIERAAKISTLEVLVEKVNINYKLAENSSDALRTALSTNNNKINNDILVVITGSFYLIGELSKTEIKKISEEISSGNNSLSLINRLGYNFLNSS